MLILRPTRKLGKLSAPAARLEATSDTALGDWYVNRIVIDRQPLLIAVSSASLLTMLMPAREVRLLPERFPDLVAQRLIRAGIVPSLVAAERAAMEPVMVAPTLNRSVVGFMVDFAKMLPYYLNTLTWAEPELLAAEAHFAHTPCHAGRRASEVLWPDERAPELLLARWAS